jgi:hypothetical protein
MSPPSPSLASDPVLHDKPIALRLTEGERQRTLHYAQRDGRSASNFARLLFLRGLADYEREQAQRPAAAQAVWS